MRPSPSSSTHSSLSTTRGLALLGGSIGIVLFLAVGVAVGAVPRAGGTTPTATPEAAGAASSASASPEPTAAPAPPPTEPPATEPPATGAPETTTPPTTTRSTAKKAPATTIAEPAAEAPAPTPPPAPPAPPKLPPGQRINPTSAQVQAAITQLHQRIPLFQPNESQLRTFADAVCASFDQGQSFGQVQATVQQAVSNVQGASLSAPDAEFAVRTVLELRCPGWLP
jgi:hypothetical protein